MPDFLWYIFGFILVLTPIVIVHEFGHFIVARMNGIRVEEFGIGFPPKWITLFEQGGTKFVIGSIPLGGYVKPAGEDDPTVPGGLASASKWARLTTLAAGSIFNFVFAYMIYVLMFMLPRPGLQVEVLNVALDSPAAEVGLMEGDKILQINGTEVTEDYAPLIDAIRANAGQEVNLLIERDSSEMMIPVTPRLPGTYDAENEGSLGITMTLGETDTITSASFVEALELGFQPIMTFFRQISSIFESRIVSPVGISQIAGEAARNSLEENRLQDILWVTGGISIALGFTNLLPIPALDGGRILFVLIEWVRGKRIEPEREGMVHAIGMMLLLLLLVVLVVQDVVNPIVLPS